MNLQITQLTAFIKQSRNTVFFGGAGVSTESGIPDFRSESGLYAAQEAYGLPPEKLLSYSLFHKQPELFFRYYKENLITAAKPNPAHSALAKLESQCRIKAVITQNIDGLHQAAGSRNVLELHGTNHRHYCMKCRAEYTLGFIQEPENCNGAVPVCNKCGGIVRPDVVLYEEQLNHNVVTAAIKAIEQADLLIVGGTSLAVYPAAGLIDYFTGDNLVLINKGATSREIRAQLIISEAIGEVMSAVMREIEV
ncbi:MAG: NAD-dependent protein deacylase [Oscillospiraceae bacterium]|nr:NAD-dependent protein deacylase [Oscillospiraceae bacterium]